MGLKAKDTINVGPDLYRKIAIEKGATGIGLKELVAEAWECYKSSKSGETSTAPIRSAPPSADSRESHKEIEAQCEKISMAVAEITRVLNSVSVHEKEDGEADFIAAEKRLEVLNRKAKKDSGKKGGSLRAV